MMAASREGAAGAPGHREEPPVVRVQSEDFDAGAEIARLRRRRPDVGAIASFVGVVRGRNEDGAIGSMTLEHYPGMTEAAIARIVETAGGRWRVVESVVIHRVGRLAPGDQIVLVVVAAAHRGDAFHACEFIMDYLKTRAPFWKRESTPEGERWVASRASDAAAARRWDEA